MQSGRKCFSPSAYCKLSHSYEKMVGIASTMRRHSKKCFVFFKKTAAGKTDYYFYALKTVLLLSHAFFFRVCFPECVRKSL